MRMSSQLSSWATKEIILIINQIIIMIETPPVDEGPMNEAFDLAEWLFEHLLYDYELKDGMKKKNILLDHLPRLVSISVESGGRRNLVPPLCTPSVAKWISFLRTFRIFRDLDDEKLGLSLQLWTVFIVESPGYFQFFQTMKIHTTWVCLVPSLAPCSQRK